VSITCLQFFVTRLSTMVPDSVDRTQMRAPNSCSSGRSPQKFEDLAPRRMASAAGGMPSREMNRWLRALGTARLAHRTDAFKKLMGNAWVRFAAAFRRALTISLQPAHGSDGRDGTRFAGPSTHYIASRHARPKKMPAWCGSHRHESSNRQRIFHRDMTKKSSFATKYEFERALYCGVCNARHPHLAGKTRRRSGTGLKFGLECHRQERTPESSRYPGSIVAFLRPNS
jgi:hypothetical protein